MLPVKIKKYLGFQINCTYPSVLATLRILTNTSDPLLKNSFGIIDRRYALFFLLLKRKKDDKTLFTYTLSSQGKVKNLWGSIFFSFPPAGTLNVSVTSWGLHKARRVRTGHQVQVEPEQGFQQGTSSPLQSHGATPWGCQPTSFLPTEVGGLLSPLTPPAAQPASVLTTALGWIRHFSALNSQSSSHFSRSELEDLTDGMI